MKLQQIIHLYKLMGIELKIGYIYIYILQLLTLEIVGGSTVQGVDKDNNVEHVPKLESIELALVHCNLVNNGYQQASKVSCTFVPSKKFE